MATPAGNFEVTSLLALIKEVPPKFAIDVIALMFVVFPNTYNLEEVRMAITLGPLAPPVLDERTS